jgi:hypothetical protein
MWRIQTRSWSCAINQAHCSLAYTSHTELLQNRKVGICNSSFGGRVTSFNRYTAFGVTYYTALRGPGVNSLLEPDSKLICVWKILVMLMSLSWVAFLVGNELYILTLCIQRKTRTVESTVMCSGTPIFLVLYLRRSDRVQCLLQPLKFL